MNYEGRIRTIRYIIMEYEDGSGTVAEWVEALESIKRLVG